MPELNSNNPSELPKEVGALSDSERAQVLALLKLNSWEFSDARSNHPKAYALLETEKCRADPEIQAAARTIVIANLANGQRGYAENMARALGFGEELRSNDNEFDQAKVSCLIKIATRDDPNAAFQARDFVLGYRPSEKILNDPSLVSALRTQILAKLPDPYFNSELAEIIPLETLLADSNFASQVQTAASEKMLHHGWHAFSQFAIAFHASDSWLRDPAVRAAGRSHFIDKLNAGEMPDEAATIFERLEFSQDQINSDLELRKAACSFFEAALESDPAVWSVMWLVDNQFVTAEDLQRPTMRAAIEKAMVCLINEGSSRASQDLHERFKFPSEFFETPECKAALQKRALTSFSHFQGIGDPLADISKLTSSTEWTKSCEPLKTAALKIADKMLTLNYSSNALRFMERMGIGDTDLKDFPGVTGTLARNLEISEIKELIKFLDREQDVLSDIRFRKDESALQVLTKSHYEAGQALHLKCGETVKLLSQGIDVAALQAANDWEGLAQALQQHVPIWQDAPTRAGFEQAVKYFGSIPKVMQYMNRPNLLRHDALIEMPTIIKMAELSDLKPSAFYGQVLAQVAMDNSHDGDENAHQRMNRIARGYRYEETMSRCAEAADIPEVAALASYFTTGQKSVFASWVHLRQFGRLQELLDKRELLDGLRALPGAERAVLAPFVDEVAIRPGSKADLGQAVNFLVHPEKFLDTGDPHTPQHIHNGKKPINFTKIPHLDLTPKDLTLALAGGTYDLLQQLPPMQINYRFTSKSGEEISLVATLHRKSDARGYTVQNDTGSCDAFGAGKQIVSAFNPAISYFSVQLVRPDGSQRAIAQSMLTVDCDSERPVPEIVAAMSRPYASLENALSEAVLRQGQHALTCDNIEVARNYRTDEWSEAIETVYRDFFFEYLQAHGQAVGLQTDKVLVGEALTPVFVSAKRASNTWVPVAPGSYSDNLNASIIEVPVSKQVEDSMSTITSYGRPAVEAAPPSGDARIQFLRPSDALSTAYLEEGAYRDNDELVVSLQNIESCLIASHANNRLKGRPDLSLKYVADNDKMQGYLLAYEGRFTANGQASLEAGEPMIYIGDMATHSDVRRIAGGRLTQAFIDRWISLYAAGDSIPPLVAELREHTSYKLVMAKLKQVEARTGISFEVTQGEPQQRGPDRMFPTVIRAKVRERVLAEAL